MKTFVFIIPTPHRINSILDTNIFKHIANAPRTRCVVISADASDIPPQFSHVVHVSLASLPMTFVRRIMRLRDLLLEVNLPVLRRARYTARSVSTRRLNASLPLPEQIFYYIRILVRPLRPLTVRLVNWLEERLFKAPSYENICREYRPTAIILGTFTEPHDAVWLALSRRFAIPAYVVDLPWSYLENRLYAVPRPAHVCVWNERMREELLSRFPLPPELVHITGCQRYDRYAHEFPTIEREKFLTSVGLDPSKKLIVYYSASEHWNPHQHLIADLVLSAIEQGTLPKNTELLIRRGWKQTADAELLALKHQYSNLILQNADDFPDQDYASHLLYYCDVSLSIFSSLALDAAVLDKPMIYTGLSGMPEPHPDDAIIKRVYEYDFVQEALQTGGIRVAYDKPSFIKFLAEYMDNPSHDRRGRQALVEKFLGIVDGRAGERIANTIMQTSQQ